MVISQWQNFSPCYYKGFFAKLQNGQGISSFDCLFGNGRLQNNFGIPKSQKKTFAMIKNAGLNGSLEVINWNYSL